MMGISFWELALAAAVALVVLGPGRLPETARFLGHLFGRLQRQVSQVRTDIRREMALEDMKNIQREYQAAGEAAKQAVSDIGKTATESVTAESDSNSDSESNPAQKNTDGGDGESKNTTSPR